MLKLKRILSYIYKQRSHASCCLSKIDIPVVQNDSLSCCSFLEHLHSTSCQQTGLWFKRLNNNYSVIILQHSMSSGNHTADHPLKIALMSMSLSKVLLSRDCLSVQFVYFNLLYIPHFQLRERRWMEINNDTFTIRFLWQRPLLRCCGFNATTTQWQTSFVNDRSNCKVKIIASWKKKKRKHWRHNIYCMSACGCIPNKITPMIHELIYTFYLSITCSIYLPLHFEALQLLLIRLFSQNRTLQQSSARHLSHVYVYFLISFLNFLTVSRLGKRSHDEWVFA